MTITQKLEAARQRQADILSASRAAGNDSLTADEQRDFDAQQALIDGLADVDESEARSAGITAENQRVAEICELGRSFGIDVSRYVQDTTMSIDKVRAAVLDDMKKSQSPLSAHSIQVTDSVDKFRAAASDALLLRSGASVDKVADGADELRGVSLRDLARRSLIVDGSAPEAVYRMDDEKLMRAFYNPEASFPSILDSAINKRIVQAYKELPTTFQLWTSEGSVSDFKETKDREYVLGSFSEFKKVRENGELEHDTIKDEKLPTRKIDTYGKSFTMTRKAFIDDDIGFLSALPAKYTAAAKMTIEKQVYSILFNNSAIYDGKALFHADHKNLVGSGAAPSQSTIQALINLGRKQTDHFGEPILWNPRYLIVPVGYEFDLAVIFKSAQVVGSANNDINPLYNYPLEIVQTPVLNSLAGNNACPWFLAADKATCGGVQVDYLNGQKVPSIRRMEQPGVLGFQWDIWLDWGVTVRDFRGLVKNAGTTL